MFMCISQVFHKMFGGRERQSLVKLHHVTEEISQSDSGRFVHMSYIGVFSEEARNLSFYVKSHNSLLLATNAIFIIFQPKENVYAARKFQCIIFFQSLYCHDFKWFYIRVFNLSTTDIGKIILVVGVLCGQFMPVEPQPQFDNQCLRTFCLQTLSNAPRKQNYPIPEPQL